MSNAANDLNDAFELSEAENPKAWRPVVWAGFVVLLLFFGGFGLWAALAPLGSGAIAQGQLQVSSNQKTVQHLEGGIIEAINVRDGDVVREGDILIRLDDTRASVEFELLRKQYLTHLGTKARLEAERDDLAEVNFPQELVAAASDPDVQEVIAGQQRLFANRISARDSQFGLLKRRIQKTREEITALLAQQRADARQYELIQEEIADVRVLYEKGLERKPRLLALERTAVQLEGSIGNRKALIARAEQTIAETEFQLLNTQERFKTEVETSLREVQDQLIDLKDRLKAARDALDRTRIRAPQSGRVYGLRFFTVGGVIGPGEPILGIVPQGDTLVVKARIDPADIDVVEVGAMASVRLTSFSQRTTQPIDGKLLTVSADIVQPERGAPYYEARVELDRDSLAKQPELELVQGMPATVIISTGDQTLLEYLLAPLVRSFELGLREN
ncbi:MAG: HlyD family type I secretion periplasmic adaptor subunit [Nisaea sp.]|jgi:HlyD family type I secretion membrane fusion protein|uniref:HlyD family type I secretion periplasmic adaptor subunit n=1 Tax=Nisaea sp. TaxID=2024842 RepID=UPI001AFDE344|nr:HlyD family type I secretion periplasmic adaptor subunit [Nisaea sp.]MBO6560732.1 HlyD family type I secretion periplasmic adaptor subunit [Nisaea sp.]